MLTQVAAVQACSASVASARTITSAWMTSTLSGLPHNIEELGSKIAQPKAGISDDKKGPLFRSFKRGASSPAIR